MFDFDDASPLAVMAISAWLACVVLDLAFVLWDSEFVGRLLRSAHRRRLQRSNLARVLQRHGVDTEDYLRSMPANEIRAQLPLCETCRQKVRCDAAIESGRPLAGDIDFCPNAKDIERIAQAAAEAANDVD